MANTTRSLQDIVQEIKRDWKDVNYAAKPYLYAMTHLDTVGGMFILDEGRDVIARFLSNASTWRGETARRIKKELNSMLKG